MRTLPIHRLAFVVLLFNACGADGDGAQKLRVFAASSLTAAFEELGAEFERRNRGIDVDLNFAGTPQLVLQIREGAPVDVFASADAANMRRVLSSRSADVTGRNTAQSVAAQPVPFATNRLVIVTAPGNPNRVQGLADLARDDLTILLCGPGVPAGRYARQALAKAGLSARSVSDEPSVKAVVTKVSLGEADAGIVYVTDAADAGGRVEAVPIPGSINVTCEYPVVTFGTGPGRERAAAFVAFLLSVDGQSILERHGFAGP